MTKETDSLKVKAGPAVQGREGPPLDFEPHGDRLACRAGTALPVAGHIQHLPAVEDGDVELGGFLRLVVEPQAGGDLLGHGASSFVRPVPQRLDVRRPCGVVGPSLVRGRTMRGHNGRQQRPPRLGLEHAFFNAAAPPPRRDRTRPRHAARRTAALAACADAALILVFAAIGRDAHQRGDIITGVFATAWPFLAGAALAWLALRVWRAPLAALAGRRRRLARHGHDRHAPAGRHRADGGPAVRHRGPAQPGPSSCSDTAFWPRSSGGCNTRRRRGLMD